MVQLPNGAVTTFAMHTYPWSFTYLSHISRGRRTQSLAFMNLFNVDCRTTTNHKECHGNNRQCVQFGVSYGPCKYKLFRR